MLRTSQPRLISRSHQKVKRQVFHNVHEYKELSRWQRESSGLTDWEDKQSRLYHRGQEHRFNPNWVGLSKGTKPSEAQKWIHFDQMKLPNLPPEGYRKAKPIGRAAWPSAWTEEFAEKVFELSEPELREFLVQTVTQVIHEESQRDGYELRRLDMEGNPMTELPSRDIVDKYVLEEMTLRDRVVERVLEESLRIVPDSMQLAGIKTVTDLINFAVEKVRTCRVEKYVRVTDAVLEFLEKQPIQPEFGYQHARPQDGRVRIVKDWERSFHYIWQFGGAQYTPRTVETDRQNPHFIDAQNRVKAQQRFEEAKVDGSLREAHLAKIRAAAEE